MKRTISLLLVFAMLLGLCACGSKNTYYVNEQLQGCWEAYGGIAYYEFSNGRFTCETVISDISLGEKPGTYEITDNKIKLLYDNGVKGSIKYTYENGTLTLENLTR